MISNKAVAVIWSDPREVGESAMMVHVTQEKQKHQHRPKEFSQALSWVCNRSKCGVKMDAKENDQWACHTLTVDTVGWALQVYDASWICRASTGCPHQQFCSG